MVAEVPPVFVLHTPSVSSEGAISQNFMNPKLAATPIGKQRILEGYPNIGLCLISEGKNPDLPMIGETMELAIYSTLRKMFFVFTIS